MMQRMIWLEALLMGIGLAMDALAVAVALGVSMRCAFHWKLILGTAAFFGWFQFMMPVIGWLGGSRVHLLTGMPGRITAAGILLLLGGKMIVDSWRGGNKEAPVFSWGRVILLAFSTSIDALIVGISYACMERSSIWLEAVVIGVVTLMISAAGGVIGRRFGCLLGPRSGCIGGSALTLIAIKTLMVG